MKINRLSAAAFERAANETGLGQDARAMAYAVLVDGRAQSDVAPAWGVSRQRVNFAVGRVVKSYQQHIALGQESAFVSATLSLPEPLAAELAEFSAVAVECKDVARVDEAVKSTVRAVRRAIKTVRDGE